MVKRKKYFLNPISRQNFANAFAETPNLNLEVRPKLCELIFWLVLLEQMQLQEEMLPRAWQYFFLQSTLLSSPVPQKLKQVSSKIGTIMFTFRTISRFRSASDYDCGY